MENKSAKIALISMPTLGSNIPSFQLALLKPTLEAAGIDVQTFSLFMYFARHIGFKLNDILSDARPCIVSEWLWAKAAFGDFNDEREYIDKYRDQLDDICRLADCTIDELVAVRNEKTLSFLDFLMDTVDWERFRLIGFSVVFQQMNASIALARRLKETFPHIPIIFGGAVFEDDIAEGIMQGCEFIDYIHCGDGDKTFPQMIPRLIAPDTPASPGSGDKKNLAGLPGYKKNLAGLPGYKKNLAGLPGLMWRNRESGEILFNGRAPNLTDMDSTPVPDFDEYFYARKQVDYDNRPGAKKVMFPVETARGCWWGQKHQCTFCGLNRAGMAFRAKSPENVLDMLKSLSRKYKVLYFNAIDNIMDNRYVEELFGRLKEHHSDLLIHYEIRPHFNRRQLRLMKEGGLFSVQPGVESFSTHVLKLMKKNITGIRNVAFVKWCTYYGINNLYNILYGFPGENVADYEEQIGVADRIHHLQPPYAVVQARPERGSHMFENRDTYIDGDLAPDFCYFHIYPADKFDMKKVAYYYSYRMQNILEPVEYQKLNKKVHFWKQRWHSPQRPRLNYAKSWNTLHIHDSRGNRSLNYVYKDRLAGLLEFLNDVKSEKEILRAFGSGSADSADCADCAADTGGSTDTAWIQEALDDFIRKGLVLYMDERYLSLVLPKNTGL